MHIKNVIVLNVYLFFNFVNCENNSYFFNIGEDGDDISEKCLIKIIRNNIQCGNLITVVAERQVDSLLEIMSKDDCYSVITRTFYSRDWSIRNEYIVVLANDIFEFERGIINLRNDLLWNTNAKYIIQIPNIQNNKEVTTMLLKYNIFNAVFMNYSHDSGGILYTYYPFKFGNCAGDHDTVVSLGICTGDVNVFNIFSNKIPDKFDKCTIRVARHEDIPNVILESSNYTLRGKRLPGGEEYILESIGAYKGYLIDYMQTDKVTVNGVVLPNGTVTGVLKYLNTKEADISIAGFALISNRAKAFDYIWGYNYEGLNIFTATKPINSWKLVYKEFSWLTWILIGAFYCLFVAVLNFYNIIAPFLKDRVLLILKLWGYFYANTSQSFYKTKIRGILACWIWFAFFISNFYNTAFYSLTTEQNSHVHHVFTEEFDMSIYKPCISDAIRTLFEYTFNKTWPKNTLTTCNDRKKSLETVGSRNDLFSTEFLYVYTINEQNYIDEEGNYMLDVWKLSEVTIVDAMYTTRGFPLKDTIQHATLQMTETGLVQAHYSAIHLSTVKAVRAKQKAFKNLDLDTIRVAFALLFCGLFIALNAFIVEVVYKKSDSRVKAIVKLKKDMKKGEHLRITSTLCDTAL